MRHIPHVLTSLFVLTIACAPGARAQSEGPALWMVKGPHATIYLFGSVHLLQKDKPWRTPSIDAAMANSGSVWLEIPNADDAQAIQPLVMKLGVDPAHPLSTHLSKEQTAKLDTVVKAAGIPAGETALEPLRPWLAAVTLSTIPMARAGFDQASGVENVIKPEFSKQSKPVFGFETAEEQLHYFSDMPEKAQVDYLMSGLDQFDEAPDRLKRLVAAWYVGNQTAIDDLMNVEFRAKYPNLYQKLIVSRNKQFEQKIVDLLQKEGTVFVTVGAAHLVGPDGVPQLLEKAGWTVERQ